MTDTAGIVKKANEIVQICGTRDPHRIAQMLGITVMPYPFEKQRAHTRLSCVTVLSSSSKTCIR